MQEGAGAIPSHKPAESTGSEFAGKKEQEEVSQIFGVLGAECFLRCHVFRTDVQSKHGRTASGDGASGETVWKKSGSSGSSGRCMLLPA